MEATVNYFKSYPTVCLEGYTNNKNLGQPVYDKIQIGHLYYKMD
jgi:hypothetical protein